MKNKLNIPVQIPQIGQQQPQFDPSQAVPKTCEQCGKSFFTQVFRLGTISAIAPGNRTNRQILVPVPVFVCEACGWEFGTKVEEG